MKYPSSFYEIMLSVYDHHQTQHECCTERIARRELMALHVILRAVVGLAVEKLFDAP